ncbi:hypothetical protein QBC99_004602 [Beijerinckia sp. GAS462]|nr:hypothetical protein [Beijerinckia sp. GAS462]SED24259.1 hypothetical protein SAMN05443249_4838 [Beijerinckia sp. 28-YEA-48]
MKTPASQDAGVFVSKPRRVRRRFVVIASAAKQSRVKVWKHQHQRYFSAFYRVLPDCFVAALLAMTLQVGLT